MWHEELCSLTCHVVGEGAPSVPAVVGVKGHKKGVKGLGDGHSLRRDPRGHPGFDVSVRVCVQYVCIVFSFTGHGDAQFSPTTAVACF